MLQKLRDQTQSTGFQILVIAIIAVLVLFGFGATNLFMPGDPEIAQVGDFEITQNVLSIESERERRRLLAQMGEDFDPDSIDPLQLQQYALQQIINRQVLYQAAGEMGVGVSPDEVNKRLVESPAYQIEGRFDESVYLQQVRMMGYTPVEFLQLYGKESAVEQLRGGIVDTAILTDWELAEIVRVVNQRRDLAYLPLTVEQFKDQVTVSDEQIQTRYAEEQSSYMTELAVDVEYVSLEAQDLFNDPTISVTEEELRSLYEDERATALRDEQRESSHILIQVNADRSDAQALELITEIKARLAEGESFEELAEELSEDPGSATVGGSLGAVGKGIFDPAFEDMLWSMQEPGVVSEPVLTSFGYHLIRLDNVIERQYPDFDLEREGLELRVRQAKAQELFAERVSTLEELAYDERTALAASAQALGLEVRSAAQVSRTNNAEDNVLSNPGVLDALFSEDVLAGTNSELIAINNNQAVVVRVNEQYLPQPIELADVTEQIRSDLVREFAFLEIDKAKESGRARLEAGESATEIANSLGSQWQSFELATRVGANAGIPQSVSELAFNLPRPPAGEKSIGVANLPDGAALVTVTRVIQGDMGSTADSEIAELRRVATSRAARLEYQSFFQAAEREIGVTRPEG